MRGKANPANHLTIPDNVFECGRRLMVEDVMNVRGKRSASSRAGVASLTAPIEQEEPPVETSRSIPWRRHIPQAIIALQAGVTGAAVGGTALWVASMGLQQGGYGESAPPSPTAVRSDGPTPVGTQRPAFSPAFTVYIVGSEAESAALDALLVESNVARINQGLNALKGTIVVAATASEAARLIEGLHYVESSFAGTGVHPVAVVLLAKYVGD